MPSNSSEYMKDYYKRNPDKYEKHKKFVSKYDKTHKHSKEENRKSWMKSFLKLKNEIFDLLGGKCNNPNCAVPNSMSDRRCLQIDHIKGGGIKEMKRFKCYYSYLRHVLNQIKAGSRDYQLLCANCNWIKRYEHGENK